MDKIVLIGGGGHCRVVLDAIQKLDQFTVVGILDRKPTNDVYGIPVLGDETEAPKLRKKGISKAFICVGSVGNPAKRVELYMIFRKLGFQFPVILHPSTVVAEHVQIHEGTFVGSGAVIGTGTVVGKNAVVNTNSSVDHDCNLGDFCHVAPGATLCGNVTIGKRSHVGAGATVIQNVKIGKDSIVGAGSVVVQNIGNYLKAFGIPAKIKEKDKS